MYTADHHYKVDRLFSGAVDRTDATSFLYPDMDTVCCIGKGILPAPYFPPPGLVADAKFRTQTRFPDFAYAEAASKLLLDETIVLQDDFPGSESAIACDGTYSFWF